MTTSAWRAAEAEVHKWANAAMSSYVKRVKGRAGNPNRASVVNDGLWGSIRLSPLERALVDSPVLQRLRRIKQLGPALAVYPSARHTRFEHSLGALHRAATVMDALVTSSASATKGSLLVDEQSIRPWTDAVRVAALLHDAGHVFLSHAGERILTTLGCAGLTGDVNTLLGQFSQELDCEKRPGLAEFFSYAMMTSSEVASLCEHFELRIRGNAPKDTKLTLKTVAGALVHARALVDEGDRWLADVLSGPLDVDKQDYVPRDALMAGVGVQIEPHRCAEVLRVCDFREARVLNERDPKISKTERRIAITFAGISVLEDLLLSRMSLFLRVYKHQKVRLIERLVERVFDLLGQSSLLSLLVDEPGLAGIMGISDSVFYDGELLRRVRRKRNELKEQIEHVQTTSERNTADELPNLRTTDQTLSVVEALARMLHERDFPVRAFAYGRMFPLADKVASPQFQQETNHAWSMLMADAISPPKRVQLEADLVATTLEIARLAEIEYTDEDEALLRAAVCLDLPAPTTVDLAPVYIYADTHGRDLVCYERLFQPSQWLDALQDSKIVCYVHAPRSWAHVVHAAAELLFARKYGAMSQHLKSAYSRCNEGLLEQLKNRISEKHGSSRCNEQIDGLHRILTYPSFIRQQDRKALERIRALPSPEEEHPEQAGRFHRWSTEDGQQLGIIIDLQGSTAFCKRHEEKRLGTEAELREALLVALEQAAMSNVKDETFGVLPLKTEGDALVIVVALSPDTDVSATVTVQPLSPGVERAEVG